MIKKGQVSFEYFIILGIVLIVITPLSLVAYNYFDSYRYQIEVKQADQTAKILVSEAESVFFLGPDSLSTIEIYIPDNVHSIGVEDNFINIRIRTNKGIEDVVAFSNVNLTGSIPITRGSHFIQIFGNEDSVEFS